MHECFGFGVVEAQRAWNKTKQKQNKPEIVLNDVRGISFDEECKRNEFCLKDKMGHQHV